MANKKKTKVNLGSLQIQDALDNAIKEKTMGELDNTVSFTYLTPLNQLKQVDLKKSDTKQHLAEIELLPEGTWRHSKAPGGVVKVDEAFQDEIIANFKRGVVGKEVPVDVDHADFGRNTVGSEVSLGTRAWIVSLCKKTVQKVVDGVPKKVKSIFATLNLTNPELRNRIACGDIRYISPQIVYGHRDPVTGGTFNILRTAAFTNFPHIANMQPIMCLNFSEIKLEEDMIKEDNTVSKINEEVVDNTSEEQVEPTAEVSENVVEPTVEEPTAEVEETVVEPTVEETTEEAPVVEEPVAKETTEEEGGDAPTVDEEPTVEEPIAEEPVAEETTEEAPVVEEPVAEEATETTVAEETTEEAPVIEESTIEEAVAEETTEEAPVVEEPVAVAATETPVEEPVVVAATETPVEEPTAVVEATETPVTVDMVTVELSEYQSLKDKVVQLEFEKNEKQVEIELSRLESEGKLTPLMRKYAKDILLHGSGVTLNFTENGTEVQSNISEACLSLLNALPKIINFSQVATQEVAEESPIKKIEEYSTEEITELKKSGKWDEIMAQADGLLTKKLNS